MYDKLDKSASLLGGLAIGVPCELRGLEAAWKLYGRMPWARLVAPAAALARSGFAAHVSFVQGFRVWALVVVVGGSAGFAIRHSRRATSFATPITPTPRLNNQHPHPIPHPCPPTHPNRSPTQPQPYFVYAVTGANNLKKLQSTPALRAAFLIKNGSKPNNYRPPAVGERCCRRPKLADTLDAIGKHGAGWLHSAEVAGKLAEEVRAAGGW